MAKGDFVSLLQNAEKGWTSYQKDDEKRRAKRRIQETAIDHGLNAGLPWERIAKDTGLSLREIQDYSKRTRPEYGITPEKSTLDRAKGVAGAVAGAVAAPFEYTAGGIAQALNAGVTGNEAQQASARATQDDARERILRLLQDPKVPQARKDILKKFLTEQNQQAIQGAMAQEEQVTKATNPRRFAASAFEVGLTPLAFGKAPVTAGTRAALATDVASNAGFGTLGALGQEELTPKSILTGAAAGAAIPLAGKAFNKALGAYKGRGGQIAADAITDESRLLPEYGSRGTRVIKDKSRLLETGAVDPGLAVRVQPADSALTKELERIDKTIRKAQVQGGLSADEARALVQRRQQVITQIQNPESKLSRLSQIDEQIVNSKRLSPEKASALVAERQTLIQELPLAERKVANAVTDVSRTAVNPSNEVPTLARKTEQQAVSKGLTRGFDDLPTDVRANFLEQRNVANTIAKDDYDTAFNIAMGTERAPDGVEAAHFYRTIEDKALKEGDADTIRMLATKSTRPQEAREAGRAIGAYGYKDPDSPADAIRQITSLRDAAQARGIKAPKGVSTEETQQIVNLANEAETKKAAWLNKGGAINDASRLDYGRAQVAYRNYVNELKLAAAKKTLKEKGVGGVLTDVASNTKALQSSMDNSALFRQGIKTLMTHPTVWARNSAKTWKDIVKTFGGKNTLDEVAADISSRPNTDLYRKMKLGVGIDEEAFPAHLGEKFPLLGRAYKASEAAYTGFLQRTRADVADKYLQIAKEAGVDIADKKQLESIGDLVNALTGRGKIKHGDLADKANMVFFSPRLMKSHFDVLTAHQLQKGVTPFVRKQAAKNLLKIVGGTAAVLATANALKPGSVEWDPRSSNFGKIKIGNTRFDVTGGSGSVATLASRLLKFKVDNGGVSWDPSTKSSTTGDVKSLRGGGFGSQDAGDVVIDFFSNKFAPAAGVVRDMLRGEDFNGNKPDAKSIGIGLTTPLIFQQLAQQKGPDGANALAAGIAEALGISSNTYSPSPNWKASDAKALNAFKQKVGEKTFNNAYNKFNEQYNDWYKGVINNPRFKKLSNEDRQTVRTNKAEALRDEIFKEYSFDYKNEKKKKSRLEGF